jgi:hypothetical protein
VDRSPRTNRPLVRAAALVLLVCMLLALAVGPASCGNDDDSSDDPPPTSTTAPTPESESEVEVEVESAYSDYRDMVKRLLESPDPDDSELAERAGGENLAFLIDRLTELESSGRALRFGPMHRFDLLAVSIDGPEAVVRDCTIDDAQTIEVASGAVVSEGTTTEFLEAMLELSSGQWRVMSIDRLGHWNGAGPCEP